MEHILFDLLEMLGEVNNITEMNAQEIYRMINRYVNG